VILDDNEYSIVTHDGYVVKRISNGEMVVKQVLEIMWDSEMAQKGGFPHYMLKEIHEQPQVVRSVMGIEEKLLMKFAEAMADKSRLYLTGVGTTFYVAQFAQYYFSAYAGVTASLASSDEFKYMANVDEDTFVLAASQSGETYDTLSALRHAKAGGAVTGAIVNVMGSSMARVVDHLILQGSGPEICVISTKAALSQMAIMARLALRLGLLNGKLTARDVKAREKELAAVPKVIEKILNEKSGFIHTIAKEQCHIPHWLYLGRGRYYPIARESALKMKEVAYVHAEGMPSGFLKHGTIALVDDNLNCVVFMPPEDDEELYKLTLSSAEEIRARNGYVLGVMTEPKSGLKHLPFSETIILPKAPAFTAPFFEMVAAQLFSYFTATTLKRNVDRPRSLAKSVTVA
jgi:glucosamine--fructose-6-phosphate aminotransferase (isomerizing)